MQGKPDDESTLRRLLNAALELSCAPSELFLRHTCLEWVGEEPVMKIHSEVPQMDVYNAACQKGPFLRLYVCAVFMDRVPRLSRRLRAL